MRKWTVRAARTALVAAAFVAAGTGIANADNNGNTQNGLVNIPITGPVLPVAVTNNAIGVLGQAATGLSQGTGLGFAALTGPQHQPLPVNACRISTARAYVRAHSCGRAPVGYRARVAVTPLHGKGIHMRSALCGGRTPKCE